MKRLRLFTNYQISEDDLARNFPNNSLLQPHYEVILNRSGAADLALVLGHARPGMWVDGCPLGIYKLIQDPPQPGPFGRFTRFAPRWADETLTPFASVTSPRRPISIHPPIYNWHLGISFDETLSLNVSKKTRDISCIASTKQDLPGHSQRFKFVEQLEQSKLNVDVFGRGRPNPLPRGKLPGLLPYRFSVAIENTVHDHYFTEKVMDCWLAGTVPIYFGAQNLDKYFPKDSFIQLDDLNFQDFASRVRSGEFSREAFEARKYALAEARQVVIEKFSMHSLVTGVMLRGEARNDLKARGKVRVSDADSYIHSARDWLASKVYRD